MNPVNLVLYHANCLDGSIAARVLLDNLSAEHTLMAPVHYDRIEMDKILRTCTGMRVFIVDFSFTVEQTREICAVATDVVFLDHHKTAMDRFAGILPTDVGDNLYMVLDNDKSGAQLAWQYAATFLRSEMDATEPWYVAHTGDRDLWKFELEGTREITAALYSVIDDPVALMDMMAGERDDAFAVGSIIERMQADSTKRSLSRAYYGNVAGYTVPIVNSHSNQSDIGNQLSVGQPFAAVWYISGDKVHVSLRSQKAGGVDVETIARQFGGGGHKNAAGFTLPVAVPMEFIPETQKH